MKKSVKENMLVVEWFNTFNTEVLEKTLNMILMLKLTFMGNLVLVEPKVEELLPLNPPVFHILLSLADGESHGYAIMREVGERTGGKIKLGPGTLYYSIRRMVQQGLIDESEERPAPDQDDERRRYYHISEYGRRVAEAESRRLTELVAQAREKKFIDSTELL